MPRPKKAGAPEPKKRSRNGCWPCKGRKVKCGEEKPRCLNCERQGEVCDYSIRLNWGGRTKKKAGDGQSHSTKGEASASFQTPFLKSEPLLTGFATPIFDSFPIRTEASPAAQHHRSHSETSISAPATPVVPMSFSVQASYIGGSQGGAMLGQPQAFHASFVGGPADAAPFDPPAQAGVAFGCVPPSGSGWAGRRGSAVLTNSGSSVDSPSSPSAMLPPPRAFPAYASPSRPPGEPVGAVDPSAHRTKRLRLSPTGDSPPSGPESVKTEPAHETAGALADMHSIHSPHQGPPTPYSPFTSTPLSPGSSVTSDNSMQPGPRLTPGLYQGTRVSVDSMLCDLPYGYDLGLSDLDTPKNDDTNAIRRAFSPPAPHLSPPFPQDYDLDQLSLSDAESGDGRKRIAFERGGYYASPVPIKIPRSYEPLPSRLLENPMNLLYFHHFINHTARILVPHDCEQNPFRSVLPRMALLDDNLLCLLLAYSASHRARLLEHTEPKNRIALWVRDVFPNFRLALTDHSDANLTTAIMLASLEIISPNAFDVPIPWQHHLSRARQMIVSRGGPQPARRHDKVSFFLSRWFAYLDVLGSLGGSKNDTPLTSSYWSSSEVDDDDEFQIDCLMGFTSRCIGILARIAELAKQCEGERIDERGCIRSGWRPPEAVVQIAQQLQRDLHEGRTKVYKACTHRSSMAEADADNVETETREIYATNEAFHWAGLIHLYRRVLGKPSDDAEVQRAVQEIVEALDQVRPGGTAEACLLFPMFTAGCDAIDQEHREKITERLRSIEQFGMTHVRKARSLMQRVWETGKPWETMVDGEFFG